VSKTVKPLQQESSTYPLRVEVVSITPELAREWLKVNIKNRDAKPRAIQRYMEDMLEGDWRLNGSTIVFGVSGRLLDGQDRLMACVESGATFQSLVVWNVNDDDQDVMDTGVKRGFHDTLRLHGYNNVMPLASAVRLDWRWQSECITNKGTFPSTIQALRHLEANPEIKNFIKWSNAVIGKGKVRIPPSVLIAFFYRASLCLSEDAEYFHHHLTTGENLATDNPIMALRRYAANIANNTHGRPGEVFWLAIVIKAWNAFLEGRSVSEMRWRRGGAKPEPFPEMRKESL
jgi:hypothetical protein